MTPAPSRRRRTAGPVRFWPPPLSWASLEPCTSCFASRAAGHSRLRALLPPAVTETRTTAWSNRYASRSVRRRRRTTPRTWRQTRWKRGGGHRRSPVGSLHSVHAGDEGDSPSFVRELRGGTPWHGERGEPETLPSPGNGRYSSLGRDLARSFEGGGTLGVAAARLFFGVANVPARAGRLASPEPSASRTEGNASARATVAEDDETAWGTVAAIAAAERLQAAVGLQSSVAAGQAAHVIALQQSARRTRRSAAAAACDVHGALTGAYIHWCRKLD